MEKYLKRAKGEKSRVKALSSAEEARLRKRQLDAEAGLKVEHEFDDIFDLASDEEEVMLFGRITRRKK